MSQTGLLFTIARTSLSPVSEQAWMESVATCHSSLLDFLVGSAPSILSGKMSQDSFQVTQDETLRLFWEDSQASWSPSQGTESGKTSASYKASTPPIPSLGGCLTLNISEFHSAAVACSLSDALEPTGDVPARYFLSDTACKGILLRAKRREKNLPVALTQALQGTMQYQSARRLMFASRTALSKTR